MERISIAAAILTFTTTAFSQNHVDPKTQSHTMKNAVINSKGELLISPSATSSSTDFDFLMGSHTVRHKKLKSRLIASNDWFEFEGSHLQEALLGGIGNLEQQRMVDVDNNVIEGMALRLFNPKTKLWSIYWADSRTGELGVPVVGSFENGVGHFYAKELFNGKSVLVKFKWDVTSPDKPVWSQAFSVDNGTTWEWNWYMHFSKTDFVDPAFNNYFREADNTDSIGIIEIRNYLLKRGRRDEFIAFFEKNFISSQQERGGYPLGQYRVRENDNNFCWIRGFENMKSRSAFLPEFYYSDFWRQHRATANAMIANNDNVHLLRPLELRGDTLMTVREITRERLNPHQRIAVIDFYTSNTRLSQLKQFFAKEYLPLLRSVGVNDFTIWESELTENDFPQLPVFQDKNLLVTITFYDDEQTYYAKRDQVRSKMGESIEAKYDDAVTTKNTLILYPTDFTKNDGVSRKIRSSSLLQKPLRERLVNILPDGTPVIIASSGSNNGDYDFLIGNHRVLHKKLVERLQNGTTWIELNGSKATEKVLGGIGNLEQHFLVDNAGLPLSAIALRLFNPSTKLWSLYWADSRSGTLDPPLNGSFENNLGVFFGRDSFEGKDILVQFQYDKSDPDKPVWGQAFSVDSGKSWEWNWFMFFEKIK